MAIERSPAAEAGLRSYINATGSPSEEKLREMVPIEVDVLDVLILTAALEHAVDSGFNPEATGLVADLYNRLDQAGEKVFDGH